MANDSSKLNHQFRVGFSDGISGIVDLVYSGEPSYYLIGEIYLQPPLEAIKVSIHPEGKDEKRAYTIISDIFPSPGNELEARINNQVALFKASMFNDDNGNVHYDLSTPIQPGSRIAVLNHIPKNGTGVRVWEYVRVGEMDRPEVIGRLGNYAAALQVAVESVYTGQGLAAPGVSLSLEN